MKWEWWLSLWVALLIFLVAFLGWQLVKTPEGIPIVSVGLATGVILMVLVQVAGTAWRRWRNKR